MGFDDKEVKEESKPVKKAGKKVEVKNKIVVVKELPVQPVRQSKDEETGIITTYVTIEEALTSLVAGD